MSASSDIVRALSRGLDILRYINKKGSARVSELSLQLKLPRPTVYRLLRTLEETGYVALSATDNRVRLTPLAASLGDNSAGRSRLCQIAGPVIAEFTNQHIWPVDLSIYDDLHMVVQETTHARSALSIDRNMAGFPLPMLRSSSGRAYLAHCPKNEQALILELLKNESLVEDLTFLKDAWLDENLALYESQGFATRDFRTFRPKTSSLAVPIRTGAEVVGCLSVIWISKAMPMSEGIERYVDLLKKAAANIAEKYQADTGTLRK